MLRAVLTAAAALVCVVALILTVRTTVMTAHRPARSPASSAVRPTAAPSASPWVLYVRSSTSGRWSRTKQVFSSAEACLQASDPLNNSDRLRIYDCDQRP